MHCFHKNNFRSLDYDVHLTKKYKKNINWNTREGVAPQSMISHTFVFDFCLLKREKMKGINSFSFVLSSYLKLKGKEKTDEVLTCSSVNYAHLALK